MVDAFPKHYQRLFDMMGGLSLEYPIRTVLELGCNVGHFVGFLRGQGFQAEGIDGGRLPFRNDLAEYLHEGQLTDLRKVFGDRTFDLIVGQGVACYGSQFDYKFGNRPDVGWIVALSALDSKVKAAVGGMVQNNIESILESSFHQLTSGGLFVICENIDSHDRIDFSRETAQRLGYQVLKYENQEAVLQKPK